MVRMWTAVNVSTDIKGNTLSGEEEVKTWWENKESGEFGDRDVFLKNLGDDKWEEHEWKKLKNSRKFYVVGNHKLNTLTRGPNQPVTTDIGDGNSTLSSTIAKAVTPYEQETDANAFLKPSAGITSIISETDGPLGVIKKFVILSRSVPCLFK